MPHLSPCVPPTPSLFLPLSPFPPTHWPCVSALCTGRLSSPLWPQLRPQRGLPQEVCRVQWPHSGSKPQTSLLSSTIPRNRPTGSSPIHALWGPRGSTDLGSTEIAPNLHPEKTEDAGFFPGRRVSLRSQHTHPHFGKAPLRDRHALALEIAEARKPFSPKLSLP